MKKLVVALLAFCLLLSSFAFADEAAFESTIDWDAEYDVIVIGFGAAGATAATAAGSPSSKAMAAALVIVAMDPTMRTR